MESLSGLTPFRSHSLRAAPFALLFTLIGSLAAAPAFAADGDGDVDDDDNGLIEIYTLAQLDMMRNDLAGTSLNGDSTGCPVSGCIGYELANDLDFDTNQDGQINDADDYWNAGAGWEPVGDIDLGLVPPVDKPFTATFDGNGHAILNLYINRSAESHVGLFGYTTSPSLSNLMLAGSNMQVSGNGRVGALAGWANNSTINNILVRGTVQGGDATGALAGYALYSEIRRSFSSADVSGGTSTGGLVGSLDSSDIDLSGATGSVSGNDHVGGLAGYQKGSITQSYATGAVDAKGQRAGGLVGYLFSDASVTSSITNSYASGSAHGYRDVGGLLGYGRADITSPVISNSYARGAVSDDIDDLGGLLSAVHFSNNAHISINDSYWDAQTTGQANSPYGGTGLTTAAMTCPQSPDDANCSLYYQNWDDTIWDFGTNEQYPVLIIDGLVHRDSDGDGVFDALDAFPNDSSRSEGVKSVQALAGSGGGGSLPLWVLGAFSLLGLRRRKA